MANESTHPIVLWHRRSGGTRNRSTISVSFLKFSTFSSQKSSLSSRFLALNFKISPSASAWLPTPSGSVRAAFGPCLGVLAACVVVACRPACWDVVGVRRGTHSRDGARPGVACSGAGSQAAYRRRLEGDRVACRVGAVPASIHAGPARIRVGTREAWRREAAAVVAACPASLRRDWRDPARPELPGSRWDLK